MAVLIEGISVLVRHSALEERFPGGATAYQRNAPNTTFRSDGRIAGVSFMVIEDARTFTTSLTWHGFSDPWCSPSNDIAVVDQSQGFLTQCDWLNIDLRTIADDEGRSFAVTLASLTGEEPVTFSAHAGWQPRGIEQLTAEELERDYEITRVDRAGSTGGSVIAYRHRLTGRMLYVGRPALPDVSDVQRRYLALLDELGAIQAQPISNTREQRIASFSDQASDLVKTTNQLEPGPLLLQGIAARLSGRWNDAEQSFRRVTELRPELLEGWLELTWALATRDRLDAAEASAKRGVEVAPTSAAAHGNLATVLLRRGNAREALTAITRAIDLDPSDYKNQRILQQVRDAVNVEPAEVETDAPWYKRWFR